MRRVLGVAIVLINISDLDIIIFDINSLYMKLKILVEIRILV